MVEVLLVFFLFSCEAQPAFSYKSIPSAYYTLYTDSAAQRAKILKKFQRPTNMMSLLTKNYETMGREDYTDIFQRALRSHREIIIQNGTFLINKKGLSIPSSTKIYFEENAVLKMQGNKLIRYEVLRVRDLQDVKIYYANIRGDRERHTETKAEWGFGISIQDSKNIYLYKPIVKNCWGDGNFFFGSEGKIVSNNITIDGGLVDNNRRNGISITSAINLSISTVVAATSNGTFTKSGIDFEPSHNWELMEHVNVKNVSPTIMKKLGCKLS